MTRVVAGGNWLDDLATETASAFFARVPYDYRVAPGSAPYATAIWLVDIPCYACDRVITPGSTCVQVPSPILDVSGCCRYLVFVHLVCWEDAGGGPC